MDALLYGSIQMHSCACVNDLVFDYAYILVMHRYQFLPINLIPILFRYNMADTDT